MTKPKASPLEIYRADNGEWRCRIRAPNGKTVFISSEGYARKGGVIRALSIVREVLDREAWG